MEFGLEIDYQGPVSPHRQIAAWIRDRIISGEIPPGRRIPPENLIVQETGVATSTARRAVALLRDEGWIYTVPGRGSYPREPGEWPSS
jgi:GntR family transcriptional regulator